MSEKRTRDDAVDLAIDILFREFHRAEEKHPSWPTDQIHAAAIVAEESGELVQAAIDHVYSAPCPKRLELEAAQTAAMGLRFLVNLLLEEVRE